MAITLKLFCLIPCLAVIVIAACRINLLNVRKGSRVSWACAYIACSGFAADTGLGIFLRGIDWPDLVGIGSLLLFFWLDRKKWSRPKPPPESQRAPLTP